MAYIDKVTTMRRMALIRPDNGNIVCEGVNIEGTCVLRAVSIVGETITLVKADDLDGFAKDKDLIICYQDGHLSKSWEPREKSKEYRAQFEFKDDEK